METQRSSSVLSAILSHWKHPARRRLALTAVLASLLLLVATAAVLTHAQESESRHSTATAADPVGTAFTYQGQLKKEGSPVNDLCDFQFGLYDAESEGNQVGITQTMSITVTDGLFTANLNFGEVFTGTVRWLDIAVKCGSESGYARLGRQELTATPYALHAASTGALQGNPVTTTVPVPGQVLKWNGGEWSPDDDDDMDTTYSAGNQLVLTGTTFGVIEGSGSGLDADLVDGLHVEVRVRDLQVLVDCLLQLDPLALHNLFRFHRVLQGDTHYGVVRTAASGSGSCLT